MIEPTTLLSPVERDAVELVPVWDWPVRVVHWAMVVLLVALIVTGKLGNDWLEWHMRFGQTMLALVVFRVAWGFVGSRNARFAAFLRGPAAVGRYARALLHRAHGHHTTHNPVGGWMVVALLVALAVQASTGLFTNDDALWGGPFAERIAKVTSDAISTFHRQFWWVIVALSAIHIIAVLAYLFAIDDNLIAPMITGRKRLPTAAARPADAAASAGRALAVLALCALAVWYLVNRV